MIRTPHLSCPLLSLYPTPYSPLSHFGGKEAKLFFWERVEATAEAANLLLLSLSLTSHPWTEAKYLPPEARRTVLDCCKKIEGATSALSGSKMD